MNVVLSSLFTKFKLLVTNTFSLKIIFLNFFNKIRFSPSNFYLKDYNFWSIYYEIFQLFSLLILYFNAKSDSILKFLTLFLDFWLLDFKNKKYVEHYNISILIFWNENREATQKRFLNIQYLVPYFFIRDTKIYSLLFIFFKPSSLFLLMKVKKDF